MAEFRWLKELHRRHVVRAAVIYAAAVWALAQGISQLSPVFGLSAGVTLWFVIVCAIGFPFWLVFAWYYRFTPHGIERESEATSDEALTRRTGRKLDYWIIGVLAIAVVLLLTNELVLQRGATLKEFTAAPGAGTNFSPPAGSLLVLPFENLSGDPRQQYFSDGITEELTDALGQNPALRVIAWETASTFRDPKQATGEIGKTLDVANILHGSIQREGDEVRITAELVNTVTGYQIWSAHYDGTLKDVFAVQDKIARAIAGALKVKFAKSDLAAGGTTNPQAHELYLKGLAAMDAEALAGFKQAQRDFGQAVALDPNYADAQAWLAHTYVDLAGLGSLPLQEALAKTRATAHKALALDPDNANALTALGLADYDDNHEAQAREEYRRALALDPSNVAAHLDYGVMLPPPQALVQDQAAARLDPKDAAAQGDLANDYWNLGDYQRALTAARAALKLSPQSGNEQFVLAEIYWSLGDYRRALTAQQAAVKRFPPQYVGGILFLAQIYHSLNRVPDAIRALDLARPTSASDRQLVMATRLVYRTRLNPALHAKARAELDQLRRARPVSPDVQDWLPFLYLALGDKAIGLVLLSTLCADYPDQCYNLDGSYPALRGDPAFGKLVKRYAAKPLTAAAPATVTGLASAPAPASAN